MILGKGIRAAVLATIAFALAATLVKAARYLPTTPKQTKPVIYGLDSPAKEVK